MQISRIFSLAGFLTWEGRGGRFLCARFLPPSTGGPQPREKIGEFSRKALSSCVELILKATDFSPGGGRRPDCPPVNKGP